MVEREIRPYFSFFFSATDPQQCYISHYEFFSINIFDKNKEGIKCIPAASISLNPFFKPLHH